MSAPKVLLSSPPRPFGAEHGDGFSCQTSGSHQLTWAQGAFRVEDHMRHWGLDLIAANIRAESTVLHYPTTGEFRREVARGYDYVGLSFNLATLHKIRPMVRAVRELSPRSKVVLGGYGTVLPDAELEGLADHVCREEGVAFMRGLLGEEQRPIKSPELLIERSVFSLAVSRIGVVFGAVGCPNACEFCCTSHFYKRRKTHFHPSPEDLLADILALRRKAPEAESVIVFDDDFLVDEARARKFLAAVEASGEVLDIMIFASVRSLSRFEPRELALMGVSKVWIGFEGVRAGYPKQEGRGFRETVEGLRAAGISTTASMMLGFDYQDEECVRREFETLAACRPSSTQFILVTPCVGTPLWDRLERESRLRAAARQDYRLHDGFTFLFEHPRLGAEGIERLQRELYRREYELLGPSLFRVLRTYLLGFRAFKDDPHPLLRRRAALYRDRVLRARALYGLGLLLAPSREVRERLREERDDAARELGPAPPLSGAVPLALLPLVGWSKLRYRFGWGAQPRGERREYAGA